MNGYLRSGREAIRLIYYIIISLAITKAVSVLFTDQGTFSLPVREKTFLFIVFFSFVVRFFMGAYRVLSRDIELELRRAKIIITSSAFFLQALIFYVFALKYDDLIVAQWAIAVLCSCDLIWLLALVVFFGIIDKHSLEWMVHDAAFAGLIFLNIGIINLPSEQCLQALFLLSIVAFFLDFILCRDLYFSSKTTNVLRIYVAGPYGDKLPSEEIAANVARAKETGKQLAMKGHFPFIPHTMLHGWEEDERFKNNAEIFKAIDYTWLDSCDALFFIAESPGANAERETARKKGLQIFSKMNDVPDATKKMTPKL